MNEAKQGKIVKVAGPVVVADGMTGARMYDVVRVGNLNLIGEIVELRGDLASIQVYEETTGMGPGEPVIDTEAPLSVELGPGLIESIYDGIQRPLDSLVELEGQFMSRGSSMPGLNRQKKWHFKPTVAEGTKLVLVLEGATEPEIPDLKELVGEAIRGRRDDVFLVSKVLPSHAEAGATVKKIGEGLADTGQKMEAVEELMKKETDDSLKGIKKKILKDARKRAWNTRRGFEKKKKRKRASWRKRNGRNRKKSRPEKKSRYQKIWK